MQGVPQGAPFMFMAFEMSLCRSRRARISLRQGYG